jgi:hypothetical protein
VNELALFAGNGGGILGVSSLDGAPFAPSNSNAADASALPNDKTRATYTHFQSGSETYVTLTEYAGEELLTSFLEASRVRTSAQPILTLPELKARVRVCGKSSFESFASWQREWTESKSPSCSWKTRQCSLLGGLESFSETWPNWGTMQTGECWVQTTLEDSTSESAFSFWATPLERDWKDTPGMKLTSDDPRPDRRTDALPRQIFAFWPTPLASDDRSPGAWDGRQGSQGLSATVRATLWPTPTVHGNTNFKGAGPKSGNGLGTEVMTAFGPTENSSSVPTAKSAPLNPGLCGMADGVANRVDRISAIGDGQVPAVVAAVFQILTSFK